MFNLKKILATMTLVGISSINAAQAQAVDYDTIVLEGDLDFLSITGNARPNPTRFKVSVNYYPQRIVGVFANAPVAYQNTIEEINASFIAGNFGVNLSTAIITPQNRENSFTAFSTDPNHQVAWFMPEQIEPTHFGSVTIDYTAAQTPLFEEQNGIFTFTDGAIVADLVFNYHNEHIYAEGVTHTVTVTRIDEDSDGVRADDQCPASILGGTVSVNGIETGVDNVLNSSGCTIMDAYAACAAEQGEGGMMFGSYRGPSYCEQQVAYDFYGEGLIDYTEVRMLRLALMR